MFNANGTLDETTIGATQGNTGGATIEELHQEQLAKIKAKENLIPSTIIDYFSQYNPATINLTHPDLAVTYKDVLGEGTPFDHKSPEVAKALSGLSYDQQLEVIGNATTNEQALKRIGRIQVEDEAIKATSQDSGITHFAMSLLPTLTTPGSIATLPFGFLTAGKIAAIGIKSVASGAALGATAMGIDATISNSGLVGADKVDTLDSMITGAVAGGALGAIVGAKAMYTARKTSIAEINAERIVKANEVALGGQKLEQDMASTEVKLSADGNHTMGVGEKTELRSVFKPVEKDTPEYNTAKADSDASHAANLEDYAKTIEDIKATKSTATVDLEKQLEDIVKSKEAHISTQSTADATINEVKARHTVEATVAKDAIKTADEALKAHNVALKGISSDVKPQINTLQASLKALAPDAPATAKDSLAQSLKDLTGKVDEAKAVATSLKNAKVTAQEAHKATLDAHTNELAKVQAEVVTPTTSLKDLKAQEASLRKALNDSVKADKAAAKEQIKTVVKPKQTFVPPIKEFLEEVPTGERFLTGIRDDVPQLEKLFPTTELAGVMGDVLRGVSKGLNDVDAFFGSKIDYMHQHKNPAVRSLADLINPPTYSTKGESFVYGYNMMDYQETMTGHLNMRNRALTEIFNKAKKSGIVKSVKDFEEQVYRHYQENTSVNEMEAWKRAHLDTTPNMSIEDKFAKHIKEVDIKVSADTHIMEAAKAHKKFFNEYSKEGVNIGISGMKNAHTTGWYSPRVIDPKYIETIAIQDLEKEIFRMLRASGKNLDKTDKYLIESSKEISMSLKQSSYDRQLGPESFFRVGNKLPFQSALTNRKLALSGLEESPIYLRDLQSTGGAYNYKMSKRFSLQKFLGTTHPNDILATMVQDAIKSGTPLSSKDIKIMTETLEDVAGTLRISGEASDSLLWRASRTIQSYNVARLLGFSGAVQLTELFGNMATLGSRGILTSKIIKDSLIECRNAFYKPDGTVDTEMSILMQRSGLIQHSYTNSAASRYSDVAMGLNMGTFEKLSSGASNTIMKYNGMQGVLALQESMVHASTMGLIERVAKASTTSAQDTRLLARYGLSIDDCKSIVKDIDIHSNKDLDKMDFEKWDPENLKKFEMASMRNVKDTVVQGNSIHNPSFLKKAGPVQKLIFQFLRFPLTASTVLLRRGIREDRAAFGLSVAATFVGYMAVQYLKEEAGVALGVIHQKDRKFDIFNNPDHFDNLALKSAGYIGALGLMSTAYDYLATVTPMKKLGSSYESRESPLGLLGPTAGFIDQTQALAYKKLNGSTLTPGERSQLSYGVPFLHLPLVKETIDALSEHFNN
ncbi:MAG: hypothetical protein JHC33_09590 [Ignisphaera sp.]|nr:hypothetical protein [Ignisphaera sp.]